MIQYAIWDQTNLISNRFLRQYLRDSFIEISLDCRSVIINHDLEDILERCSADHLVVFQSGHFAKNPSKLMQAVEKFCEDDFFVAGHIIHHVNAYPFLHPQMFIVNMKRYREFGKPIVGYHEDSDVLDLHKPVRSEENVHDDYTPLWLKPSGELIPCVRRDFGWNLIHTSLERGLTVRNLPHAIRSAKRFIYPTDRQHTFAECLEQLSKDNLYAIPARINVNQQQFLAELMAPGGSSKPFLFNTERLRGHLEYCAMRPVAKRWIGVAAGFKLFTLWFQWDRPKEVIYFDHNHEALKMWKNIVQNWSGKDFRGFCQTHGYDGDFSKMQLVYDVVGEDNLETVWKEFQATEPRFIYCDILREPEKIVELLGNDGNYLWYSNCFEFYEGIRRYGLKGCQAREEAFKAMVLQKSPDTVLVP